MTEKNQHETVSLNDQMTQLEQQLERLTDSHLRLKKIVEQLESDFLREIKQQHVQVAPSVDKSKEVTAYIKENRSFIQSIWKKKHK